MDDDRLLRNYTDYGKSLLQDVCFAERVSQFKWARLAALVGGETTAGMLSSDAVRAAHVCSGFMVKKMPWALFFGDIHSNLICLERSRG